MSCVINSGYKLEICGSQGGNSTLYIANFEDVKNMGFSLTASTPGGDANIITAFTGTTASFYEFEAELEQISFTEDIVKGSDATITWFEPTAIFKITKLSAKHKAIINSLSLGKFVAIVKDNTGLYHYLGASNGLRATAGNIGTGLAWGDFNGATLTIAGKETKTSFIVDETAVTSVIVPA